MTDVSFIACLYDFFHNRPVVYLLVISDFTSARIACRMIVPYVILILPNTGNYITIHNLYMKNIKQQFHSWRIDTLDYIHNIIRVVPLIIRMPYHLLINPAVKYLQTNVDLLSLDFQGFMIYYIIAFENFMYNFTQREIEILMLFKHNRACELSKAKRLNFQ